jgi:hypothetical protein
LLRHCEEWWKEVWSWQGAPFQWGAPFSDRLRYIAKLGLATSQKIIQAEHERLNPKKNHLR